MNELLLAISFARLLFVKSLSDFGFVTDNATLAELATGKPFAAFLHLRATEVYAELSFLPEELLLSPAQFIRETAKSFVNDEGMREQILTDFNGWLEGLKTDLENGTAEPVVRAFCRVRVHGLILRPTYPYSSPC